jgi:hypothetical protein
MAPKPNGKRKRLTLEAVPEPPAGASVLNISGGPFVAQKGDTELLCGSCGKVVAVLPGTVRLAGDKGPAVLVCYACAANNIAP